jgi:spermidine synthase
LVPDKPRKLQRGREAVEPQAARSPATLDRFLAATVFITGAAVLVIEIAGSRVLAPYYGSGLYSWSALISVTLAALAAGYALGGRAADRRPAPALFFTIILAAGALVFAIPWIGRFVIRSTAGLGPRMGVVSAGLLLFLPPLALLGAATPFAIRLARPPEGALGSMSGRLFAISTAGSLMAAVATGFLLLPNLGVKTILGATGILLMALAAVGLQRARSPRVAAAVAALLLALALTPRLDVVSQPRQFKLLARTPSFYGLIRVVEGPAWRVLTVDGVGQNYVSLTGAGRPTAYQAFIAAMPAMHRRPQGPPLRALVVGLGAGQLVRMLEAAGLRTEVVEIDPRIEQTARRWFGFDLPKERVHVVDGRVFLESDTAPPYDYVILDAFLGEEAPWHLFTVEALDAARARIAPGGLLLVNYTSVAAGADVNAVGATLRRVFPYVAGYTDGSPAGELAENVFVAADAPFALNREMAASAKGAELVTGFLDRELPKGPGTVLTDDFNPINVYRTASSRKWRESMVTFLGKDWDFLSDF